SKALTPSIGNPSCARRLASSSVRTPSPCHPLLHGKCSGKYSQSRTIGLFSTVSSMSWIESNSTLTLLPLASTLIIPSLSLIPKPFQSANADHGPLPVFDGSPIGVELLPSGVVHTATYAGLNGRFPRPTGLKQTTHTN